MPTRPPGKSNPLSASFSNLPNNWGELGSERRSWLLADIEPGSRAAAGGDHRHSYPCPVVRGVVEKHPAHQGGEPDLCISEWHQGRGATLAEGHDKQQMADGSKQTDQQ